MGDCLVEPRCDLHIIWKSILIYWIDSGTVGRMKKDLLHQYLQDKRLSAGLTQAEVAAELGYSSSQFISNWERGLSAPPISVIAKLSSLYGVSEESLFEYIVQNALVRVESGMRDDFKKSIRRSK